MKSLTISLVALAAILGSVQAFAGDVFFRSRVARTRCCIPDYAYRAGGSPAVSAVVSEPAILFLKATEAQRGERVTEQSRAFVFNDVTAGPLVLSGLAAKTDPSQKTILISGILNHTGGDSGQLLGGKAVIRVELLSSPGSTAENATAIAGREMSFWIRRNEPETVQIPVQYRHHHPGGFGDVDRVRLFLEYHPNR